MHTNAHHTSQTSTENRHDEYITVVEQLQTENACFGLLGLISAMQLKGDNLSTRIQYDLSFVRDKFVKGSDERTKQDIALMTGRIRKWLSMMKRPETGNQMRREKELTQNLPDVGGISELMEDRATSKMEAVIARAVEGPIWKLAWWCIT